jgi:hypothetical protein
MKRRLISILLTFTIVCTPVTAYAAASISQIIPENPTVVSGNLEEGERLVVQNANTSLYTNQKVAETVEWVNNEDTVATVKEILTRLDVDTKTNVQVSGASGKKTVNPTLYEQLTPFVDLAIQSEDEIKYTSSGSVKASITIEAAKNTKKKEIMIMQIDPTDGKVYFVAVDKLNSKTGEITAEFPTLGPISLIQAVPIVVKGTNPDDYENEKAVEVATTFEEKTSDIALADVLQITGGESGEITVSEGVTINPEDYSSTMGFADLAIKQGDGYLYDMGGSLEAEVERDISDMDWQSMIQAVDPEFDTDAAEENLGLLTEQEPFTIEGSFVMVVNTVSGESSYIYEPELSFEYQATEEEEEEEDTEEADTEETEATEETADAEDEEETEEEGESLYVWSVTDEDKTDTSIPNLKIKGEFGSMGIFSFFMPEQSRHGNRR